MTLLFLSSACMLETNASDSLEAKHIEDDCLPIHKSLISIDSCQHTGCLEILEIVKGVTKKTERPR